MYTLQKQGFAECIVIIMITIHWHFGNFSHASYLIMQSDKLSKMLKIMHLAIKNQNVSIDYSSNSEKYKYLNILAFDDFLDITTYSYHEASFYSYNTILFHQMNLCLKLKKHEKVF